jgi:hypothetical protein
MSTALALRSAAGATNFPSTTGTTRYQSHRCARRVPFAPTKAAGATPLCPSEPCVSLIEMSSAPPLRIGWNLQASRILMGLFVYCRSACRVSLVLSLGDLCLTVVRPRRYANVTLGESCILEKTTYYSDVVDTNGQRLGVNVMRSNCKAPGSYCDPTTLVCQPTKAIGASCIANPECEQVSPIVSAISVMPKVLTPTAKLRFQGFLHGTSWKGSSCCSVALRNHCFFCPDRLALFQSLSCVATNLNIKTAMTVTCVALTLIHKRHRYAHYQEVRDYYLEQIRSVPSAWLL